MADQDGQPSLWLAEFQIKNILGIEDNERLQFTLSDGAEVYLENSTQQDSSRGRALKIVFSAEDIDTAEKAARSHARYALDLASFCTQTPFTLIDQSYLLEWSPGIKERRVVLYFYEPRMDEIGTMEQTILSSATIFSQHISKDVVRRALRWYAAGVRAEFPQDQFQYFWLAIEQVAGSLFGSKQSDRCATCQTELHCAKCDGPSVHGFSPGQRVRQMLSNNGVPNEVTGILIRFRNALMHGDDETRLKQIASKLGGSSSYSAVVDAAGQVAWGAIISMIDLDSELKANVHLGRIDTYVVTRLTTGLHGTVTINGDPNAPRFSDIVLPSVQASMMGRNPDGTDFNLPMSSGGHA